MSNHKQKIKFIKCCIVLGSIFIIIFLYYKNAGYKNMIKNETISQWNASHAQWEDENWYGEAPSYNFL